MKTFSLRKCCPKCELSKKQQKKCCVNAENVNAENANPETVSGMVYDKSRCGFRKAMVEQKLVLFVLLLCCFNTAAASESGDYGGLYRSTLLCIALVIKNHTLQA